MTGIVHPYTDNRIAAIFEQSEQALNAAKEVKQLDQVNPAQVKVLAPRDPFLGEKLEGPSSELGKSMLIKHITWGVVGIAIGAITALLLVLYGPELTQQNPLFTYVALISPGLFIGLFISGLLSLRPDHDPLNGVVKRAGKTNGWSVVVHLNDNEQRSLVEPVLKNYAPTQIA